VTKIYYFSGTGNTLWSAKRIAEALRGAPADGGSGAAGAGREECRLFNIGAEAQRETVSIEADCLVILFPAYGYGLPGVVRRFLKKAVIRSPYTAFLVTFGTSPGGALAEAGRIAAGKGLNRCFYGRIPSAENYIALFGPPAAGTLAQRLAMQEKATDSAALSIKERGTNRVRTFRPLSSLISLLFSAAKSFFYRMYKTGAECNGCGLCAKLCPVQAIVMKDGRPAFTGKCEHCQACLNWCPREAIGFGRLRSGVPRYRRPGVNIEDMLNGKSL